MATHSSILAWRIPGMGEPGGLLSMGSHRVRHDWSDLAAAAVSYPPRRPPQPQHSQATVLPYFVKRSETCSLVRVNLQASKLSDSRPIEWKQTSSTSWAECWNSQPFPLRNQCAHGSSKKEKTQNLNFAGRETKTREGKSSKEFYIIIMCHLACGLPLSAQ